MTYYDPMGEPISFAEWGRMYELRIREEMSDDCWWRRRTEIDDEVHVSTVWLGLDHSFGFGGPPLIWETMIFGGPFNDYQWRYPSRPTALDDHERIVRALRAGEDPDPSQYDSEAEIEHLRNLAEDEPDP